MTPTHTRPKSQKPSPLILLLLICVVATTIATSAIDDGSTGRTSTNIEWRGQNQRMKVIVAPLEERLAPFGYDGPFHVTFEVPGIPQVEAEAARWSLRVAEAGEDASIHQGGFIFGGEVYTEDNGSVAGDLIAHIGIICEGEQTEADDCIPCNLVTGCTLEIDFDRCHPARDEATMGHLIIGPPGGQQLELHCAEGQDEAPCRYIGDWLESESEPTDANLCVEPEMSDDETP